MASASVSGVDGQLKNIIFASTGLKPRIVLRDAINNVVEVVENAEYCLFYDRPLSEAGPLPLTSGTYIRFWEIRRNDRDRVCDGFGVPVLSLERCSS